MVGRPIAVLLVVAVLCSGAAAATPEASLELGLRAFRAGDLPSATVDLDAAAQPFGPSELQTYVEGGRLDRLPSFETSLIYLALAQFRLGREDDARETILRLIDADRLGAVYATLPLQADASEFETLVAALVPASNLPRNVQIAATDPSLPLPTVRPSSDQPAAETPVEQRAVRQVAVREYVTRENERLQRLAAEEIEVAQLPPRPTQSAQPPGALETPTVIQATTPAEAPTLTAPSIVSVERQVNERVAEAQEEAARQIAATEAAARQRIAAAETAARQAQDEADARVAAAQREAAARESNALRDSTRAVTVPEPLSTRGTGTGSAAVRAALDELRQAEALADHGEFEDARAIYQRLVSSAPREIVAVAAVGLYRIGSYREAVNAFQRLGAFARGEEDLHYYFAVSLYEAGQYEAARRELACAMPFIQVSDEVARYRLKIEQTLAQLSAPHF
jgi:tetratricopeptide (TPR) repeat protein